MTIRTIGQRRAEFALEAVLKIKSDKKEFKSFSAGAPSTILQNGFGQALAFWKSKDKEKHYILFEIVMNWLIHEKKVETANCAKSFIKSVCKLDQSKYLEAQKETLALLEWVKRYASAFLEEDNDDTGK